MFKNRGFSLLELLVTVSIAVIIISIIMYSVNNVRKESRDTQRFADLKIMQEAVELYKLENGTYPSTSGSWRGAVSNGSYGYGATGFIPGLVPNYIDQLPADPRAGEMTAAGVVRDWIYRSDGYGYKIVGYYSAETLDSSDCSSPAHPLKRGPSYCQYTTDGFSIARYNEAGSTW